MDKERRGGEGHGSSKEQASFSEAWQERIDALLAQNRVREAMAACLQAMGSEKEGQVEARFKLALVLSLRGRLEEARRELEEAVLQAPWTPSRLEQWGQALLSRGRINEAIDAFREAAWLAPHQFEVQIKFNETSRLREKLQSLVESATNQAQVASNSPDPHSSDLIRAFFSLGLALTARGLFDEARETWENLLKLRPDYAEAHNNLGVVLSRLERREDAISHYRKAIELNAQLPEPRANLASALDDQGPLREWLAHGIPLAPLPSLTSLPESHPNSPSPPPSIQHELEDAQLKHLDWTPFDHSTRALHTATLIPTTLTLAVEVNFSVPKVASSDPLAPSTDLERSATPFDWSRELGESLPAMTEESG